MDHPVFKRLHALDLDEIAQIAAREIAAEDRRAAIEQRKAALRERQRRSLWQRIFPFTVTIERR